MTEDKNEPIQDIPKHNKSKGSVSVSELLKEHKNKDNTPASKEENDMATPTGEDTVKSKSSKNVATSKSENHNGFSPAFNISPNAWMWIIIGAVSFALRFIRSSFSDNGTPIFDEKHYVTQAMEMLGNSGMENNPGYGLVVHPPMGKWLISIGEIFFGYSPLGWRLSSIIAGVITVLLVSFMIKRLTNSYALTIFSAVLINIEGISIGMSRFGMLDSFIELFATMVAVCMMMFMLEECNKKPWHKCWWLFSAGIIGGLMMATKISGVYYMAICGILLVVGVSQSGRGIKNLVKATGMGLVFFFVVPVTMFFACFIPWFSNENAVYRHAVEQGLTSVEIPHLLQKFPLAIQNFYYYQMGVIRFHSNLSSGPGNFHPYESKAWEWFLGSRPMLFYSESGVDIPFTSGGNGELRLFLFANPMIWLLAIVVFAVAIIKVFLRKSDIGWILVFAGFIAGWIPWLALPSRQMYLFYTAPLAPFVVIGLTLIVRGIARKYSSSVIGVWSREAKEGSILEKIYDRAFEHGMDLEFAKEEYAFNNGFDSKDLEVVYDENIKVIRVINPRKNEKIIKRIAIIYGCLAIVGFILFIPWLYGIPVPDAWHKMWLSIPTWEPVNADNIEKVVSFLK